MLARAWQVAGQSGFNAIPDKCNHGLARGASRRPCTHARGATGVTQRWLAEAAFYPYVIVLTKRTIELTATEAPRHGTMWQPQLAEFMAHAREQLQLPPG